MAEPVKIKIEYENPNNIEAEVPRTQKVREAVNNENGEGEVLNQHKTRQRREKAKLVRSQHVNTNSEDKSDDKKTKTRIPVSRFRQTVERVKAERRGSTDKREPESQIPIRRSSMPKQTISKVPLKPTRKSIAKIEVTDQITSPVDEFDKLYEEVVHSTSVNIDVSILDLKVEDPEKLESKFEEIIHDYNENKVQPVDVEKTKKSKIPFLKRRSHNDIDVGNKSSKIVSARDRFKKRHSSLKSNDLNNLEQTAFKSNGRVDDKLKFDNRHDVKLEETCIVEDTTAASDDKLKSNDQNNTKNIDTNQNTADDNEVGETLDSSLEVASYSETAISTKESEEDESSNVVDTLLLSEIKTGEKETDQNTAVHNEVSESLDSNVEMTGHPETIIVTSSKETQEQESESLNVVGTSLVTEMKTNESCDKIEYTKGQMIEENVYVGYDIKIDYLVFDSYVHEHTEENKERRIDVEKALSNTPGNEEFKLDNVETNDKVIEINDEPTVTEVVSNIIPSITEIVYTSENTLVDEHPILTEKKNESEGTKEVMKEKDGSSEDIAKLRGKVSRLITKMGSQESAGLEAHRINFDDDLPKKKSVLSKIAMFERHDVPPKSKSKIPKIDTKLSKPLATNTQLTDNVHVHTPLVVDEVFKPFQAKINDNIDVNNVEVTTNTAEEVTETVRAEMIIIESPDLVHYEVEKKVQIESDTLSVEKSTVSKEELMPVPKKFEASNEYIINENYKKDTSGPDAPVIIPKYIRVKEVLKRYESLKGHDEAVVNNKIIEDLPKIKPISEIINAFKPEVSHTTLDAMFAHQPTPISKILNDLKPDKGKIENTSAKQNNNNELIPDNSNNDEVDQNNDIKNREFKSFKSREYKTLKSEDDNFKSLQFIQDYHDSKVKDDLKRAKSFAELDLGDTVKGKVNKMIVRINSVDKIETEIKEVSINIKEMPRKRSVSEKIALFERKLIPAKEVNPSRVQKQTTSGQKQPEELTDDIQQKIAELTSARVKYGKMENMPRIELANGVAMPVLAVGTALLDPRLAYHIVTAAIDLGYRAIDTAYIYGNERVVGEAIRAKINDGTVTREELFITSKLWSTFHRTDLVRGACEASLHAMGLDYFDLYLIHNPMSFKEGGALLPKIATVLQYSEHDYLDAWFGMETLGSRAKALGVSNFNSAQIRRVLDRARVKPVVNQVECHPYLSQQRLDDFCSERNITLSCFGVLGSKGTPLEYKSGYPAAIDDPLLQVMASGLNVSPAQLLIRYQIECGHSVVVKSSSAAHLWDNLQALNFNLTSGQVDALHALNRNKRTFTFRGMGDTHKNYPFNAVF